MCLFLIFGIAPREKIIGREMRYCASCERETLHAIVEHRMWFYLFFVPIFPVSGSQVIARCQACGHQQPESREAAFEAPRPSRAYRGRGAKVCPNCGAEVVEEANYCQYCGHEFVERGTGY